MLCVLLYARCRAVLRCRRADAQTACRGKFYYGGGGGGYEGAGGYDLGGNDDHGAGGFLYFDDGEGGSSGRGGGFAIAAVIFVVRKKGVKTKTADSAVQSKSCPRCGAPFQITSAGKCEYCGSIVTTGEFSWVLTDMDAVKPGIQIDNCGVLIQDDTNNGGQDNVSH